MSVSLNYVQLVYSRKQIDIFKTISPSSMYFDFRINGFENGFTVNFKWYNQSESWKVARSDTGRSSFKDISGNSLTAHSQSIAKRSFHRWLTVEFLLRFYVQLPAIQRRSFNASSYFPKIRFHRSSTWTCTTCFNTVPCTAIYRRWSSKNYSYNYSYGETKCCWRFAVQISGQWYRRRVVFHNILRLSCPML